MVIALLCAALLALGHSAAAYTQVPHLYDSTFEHLTQAASGQTTGIWWVAGGPARGWLAGGAGENGAAGGWAAAPPARPPALPKGRALRPWPGSQPSVPKLSKAARAPHCSRAGWPSSAARRRRSAAT